jgi:hypothetical protein
MVGRGITLKGNSFRVVAAKALGKLRSGGADDWKEKSEN